MARRRIQLHGFNNLTKALSFNIYDLCYATNREQREKYIAYIDEAYNAERLTQILTDVSNIIGANILNIARQDYDPQGASVTMLIAEEPVTPGTTYSSAAPGPRNRACPPRQEPYHGAHLSGKPSARRHLHLSRRHRCGDLRRDFAAQGAELSDPQLRIRYRHGRLSRARIHP